MTDELQACAVAPADLLEEILEGLPYAVAVFDRQMRYVAHSKRWLTAYHLPDESLVGRSHYEIFPEIGSEWKRIHQECLNGAVHSREDEPFFRKDGSLDYVTWRVVPWKQAGGEIVGIIMYTLVSTRQVIIEKRNCQYQSELKTLMQVTRAVPWRLELEHDSFTYLGSQLENLVGFPAKSINGLGDWATHIHPDDRQPLLAHHRAKVARGENYDHEYRVISRSGGLLWLRHSATVIENDSGNVVALTGLFIDISEQKLGEERIRRSEAQYRSVIETSGDGFWLVDMQGYLLEVNEAYARMSGYSKEELVGMHISELEAKEKPEETAQHIEKIINTGYDLFETRHRKKSGEIWDVEISTSFTLSPVGRFFVFARDITDRKRMQEKLKLIAEIFKNTAEGIVITNPDSSIVDVNQAYCDITGYSREEIIGAKPNKVKSDMHDPAFYARMWNSLIEKGRWTGEIWDRRKNGEVFPKWLNINAIYDDTGKLSNYVGIFSDISNLRSIETKLEYMAYYDPLTDLPNRLLFKERLTSEINNCRRFGSQCAVIFLDLDRFKMINDSLGHIAGDELLIEISSRIQSVIAEKDTVARMGGDEFNILLPNIRNSDAVASVAQKVIDELMKPLLLHGEEIRPGCSIGIALYPDDGEDYIALTRHADAAMYEAKSAGKGQYRFFSEEMDHSAHEHLTIERDLYRALEEGQFFLVFQPQVNPHTGQVVQCEALLRWNHPERGVVTPDKFIAIAEDTGLIHPIGSWVIREACRNIGRWRQSLEHVPPVAINLSAMQFLQDHLVEDIMQILDEHEVEVSAIEFEITESVAMENAEATLMRLSALTENGFSIAIDDFGTGYSSLSYLKRFPVHKLKLDRSFVMDIQNDENNAAISSAVIHMAIKLDLTVVAEGVETLQQSEFLMAQGCSIMQGYFYSKPLESDAFLAYLSENKSRQ